MFPRTEAPTGVPKLGTAFALMARLRGTDTKLGNGRVVLPLEYRPSGRKGESLLNAINRKEGRVVKTDDPRALPKVYRAPKLTVYGSVAATSRREPASAP